MWIFQPWIEWVFGDCIDGMISLAGRAGGNSRHKAEALRQHIRILTIFDHFPDVGKMMLYFFHPKKLPAR
jgi:hypothetical protein